jgi:hypothetical protein
VKKFIEKKLKAGQTKISSDIKKAKVTLIQALRLCTGRTASRGSRGIAVLYRH